MRVTDLTKQNSIMRNIGSRGGKMQEVQDNISSGRRINTLSDDPVGATQAVDWMGAERTSGTFIRLPWRQLPKTPLGDEQAR